MLTLDEKEICKLLGHYIFTELPKVDDIELFSKRGLIELGEFYYQKALHSTECATEHLLQTTIKTLTHNKTLNNENDFFLSLCNLVGIKKSPRDMLLIAQRQYNEIFTIEYENVLSKIDANIASIDNDLASAKEHIEAIQSRPARHSLLYDLEPEEIDLSNCHTICNHLRTTKEQLMFLKQHTHQCIHEFYGSHHTEDLQNILRIIALNASRDTISDIPQYFSHYKSTLSLVTTHIDKPYTIFFKVKLYSSIDALRKTWYETPPTISLEEKHNTFNIAFAKIPSVDDLYHQKNCNSAVYLNSLKSLVSEHEIIKNISISLSKNICLRERRALLSESLALFQERKFPIFNHIITLQVEGLFGDFLKDASIFNRFSNMTLFPNDVLKEKLLHLQDIDADLYVESIEYFKFYFNNIIRNELAHGNHKKLFYDDITTEIFAYELLLDFNFLIFMISKKSETSKMHRFVSNYKARNTSHFSQEENSHFLALFSDLNGSRIQFSYDSIETYRPLQIAYWLVNPYYEKLFASPENSSDLFTLRKDFLSFEFWEYIVTQLENAIQKSGNFEVSDINMELLSVVNGLFKCNISPEVKELLKKVHATLREIKLLQSAEQIP